MTAGCFSACSADKAAQKTNDKIEIVTTIFPEYDWVMNVLGNNPANADVTLLLDNGVDLHSFQPTTEDIIKVSTCDLFIYVGGESDEWVEDVLKEAVNKDMTVINLMDVLGDSVKEEEVVEGMEEEHDHDHDHDEHDEDHDHEDEDHDHEEHEHEHHHEEGEIEYDEHVWLSLRNASVLVGSISDAMQKIDPENTGTYKANADSYIGKLKALDDEYRAVTESAVCKTLLFGDRFPFRYMVDDYGLEYYAAFTGCSAESEASFETVTFLAKKVDELSLHTVLTIERRNHRIAETIIENTEAKNQTILSLDSMQSTTMDDIKNGTTYISVMESNLAVLEEALNPHESAVKTDRTSVADVDIDLTELSANMVYATVFDMLYEPEIYVGKVVKMEGMFTFVYDEASEKYLFACIISDAMACCSQGIEFIPADGYNYPEGFPKGGENVTVTGVFEILTEDGAAYVALTDAEISCP